MSTVVTSLRPTLRLEKLEGDAAFAYAITDAIDGPALQDTVERSYFEFQRRLRDIRQASSCECNACILVPALDLKFVLHHGQVVRQRIGTSEELVGSDVIVVYRLLKSGVGDATGIGAYALYTDASAAAMALDDPSATGMVRHVEAFDDVGEIGGWVVDLHAAWLSEQKRARLIVEADEAIRTYQTTIDAPPALVWSTSPRPGCDCSGTASTPSSAMQDRRAGEASARSTTACTEGTRSSRRSSTGSRMTTSPIARSYRSRTRRSY